MAGRKGLPSDEIRHVLYDCSEGDQFTDNPSEVLHSDDDFFSSSDNDFEPVDLEALSPSNTTESFGRNDEGTLSNEDEPTIGLPPSEPANNTDVCHVCKWKHDDNFDPTNFVFDSSNCGLLISDYDEVRREIDMFHILFDYDLVSHIASETNKYYKECLNKQATVKEFSKLKRWSDTNPDELYCFFALLILMPHCRKNNMKQYWSTDPLLETPMFPKVMSQDRFLLLLRMLHLDDNTLANGGDKLYKIRTVLETTRRKFATHFVPFQNLVIDESLMLWKGRLAFKQFIPSKRNRFGIKLFVLCDCTTGIVLDFIVYTGKGTDYSVDDEMPTTLNASEKVIQTLLQPYLGKNHNLFVDNWYSSPKLFSWLHEQDTGACGTVRSNRKGLPCLPKNMKKGDVVVRNNGKLLAVKWCDRRNVTMLTSIHNHEMLEVTKNGSTIVKPKAVVQYNKNMGAVDKTDMMTSFNDTARKSTKWYRKLFFHVLDIILLNAFHMYNLHTGIKQPFMEFRTNLVRQLLETHCSNDMRQLTRPIPTTPAGDKNPLRLSSRHFIRPLPENEERKRKIQRKCHVCMNTTVGTKRRKDTSYECSSCRIPLCIHPCFEEYHTKVKY